MTADDSDVIGDLIAEIAAASMLAVIHERIMDDLDPAEARQLDLLRRNVIAITLRLYAAVGSGPPTKL